MASVFAGQALADVLLKPVAWLSAPTKADVEAAFPRQTADHESGYADLQCRLAPNGALSDCTDAASSGLIFDHAALSLAPKFRASVPVDLGPSIQTVWVEVRFNFPYTRKPLPALELTDPEYVQAAGGPSASTPLPAAAASAGVKRGFALVDCAGTARGALTDCSVVEETPAGMGIGGAALAALSTRRLNLWQDGSPVAGAGVRIPFYIDAPDADADPTVTREAAFHVPAGCCGTAGPYYPQEAAQKRIGGSATIECNVHPTGPLADCVAISETPPGWHFLDAALKMAQSGAITASGLQDDEHARVVRITVPFRP